MLHADVASMLMTSVHSKGRNGDDDKQICEVLESERPLGSDDDDNNARRCERLGCRADLEKYECIDRGCQYLKLTPFCGADGQDSAQANCAGKEETGCDGACAWKKPQPTCVSGFSGGTDKQAGAEVVEGPDAGGELDPNSKDNSCYGFSPVIDADSGQPKSDPPADDQDRTAKQFCESVKDKADNAICKYTDAEAGSPMPWGKCETFNQCAEATDTAACNQLDTCKAEISADGVFEKCAVNVLGGDNENADNDEACFVITQEDNCKSAASGGRKLCAWTTSVKYKCQDEECEGDECNDAGNFVQVGPDDACDSGFEKVEEEQTTCSDICQSSGKDKSTCQTAGCCYKTLSETKGFCFAKSGDSCDDNFGNSQNEGADAGDFSGGEGDSGGNGDSADAAASCFQHFDETACIHGKSDTGSKLAICMWSSNLFTTCSGDGKCSALSDEDCESTEDCTLSSEDHGFCIKNDPCGVIAAKGDCNAQSDDGCSWQETNGEGFCIVDSNQESFDSLSSEGTCSFNKDQEDAEGGGLVDTTDITESENSFAGADACRQLIEGMKTVSDSEVAAADKKCTQALDLDGNNKCAFRNENEASEICKPIASDEGGDEPDTGPTGGGEMKASCQRKTPESKCPLTNDDAVTESQCTDDSNCRWEAASSVGGDAAVGIGGGADPSAKASTCYNYGDKSTCALFGSDECEWGLEEQGAGGAGGSAGAGSESETDGGVSAGEGLAAYVCEEIEVETVDKCAKHNGERSCENVDGCEFKEVVDLFAGGTGSSDTGNGDPSQGPAVGLHLTDVTGGALSTTDLLNLGAACEAAGKDGAVSCAAVKSEDKDGIEKKLCKYTSTTTLTCEKSTSSSTLVNGGAEVAGPGGAGFDPAACSGVSTDGGDESECAKTTGCVVETESYGRCTPMPHKCTTYDADECQADSDCVYNPPNKGLCMEDSSVGFFDQTDAEKSKALACKCLAEDSALHFAKENCEAAGCQFFENGAQGGSSEDVPFAAGGDGPNMGGGDAGGTATGNGGSSSNDDSQMCSAKDNDGSTEESSGATGGSFDSFDECACIEDENADGCAEANSGSLDLSSSGNKKESMSICQGVFLNEACEAKKTKSGDKACDWQISPAQYICNGNDDYCSSADRYIMSTGQLNITSCEANSKCSKEKVQDASGFCSAHNPCTPHTGNPSACSGVDGCLYDDENICVEDLNEYAACEESSCCYDVVSGMDACKAKKMVDGSRACQFFRANALETLCQPKTPDANCPLLDDAQVTESQCNANDNCNWDEGMDISGGSCEPFNVCHADGVNDDESGCLAVEDADSKALCLWYTDEQTEENYCVNKEDAGADNMEELAAAILDAENGEGAGVGGAAGSGSSGSCTLLFTKTKCEGADRGDLPHPKCSYSEDQCIAYDPCRSVKAGENEENCDDAGCSWESNDPLKNRGVCKKKLGEIDSESDFECVPVDAGAVSEGGNIKFSTEQPTTTLDPRGCCVISKGLFDYEVTCAEDYSAKECFDYQVEMTKDGFGFTVLRGATTCADASAEGVKLCPQGKTTTIGAAVTPAPKKTTTEKPNVLVLPSYRIFVTLQSKQGAQVMLADQQRQSVLTSLMNTFASEEFLNLDGYYDSSVAGKMFFYRAGGLEIRFPKSIPDQHRPLQERIRKKVLKLNNDATGNRRRRAVTGAKVASLSFTRAVGPARLDAVFVAGMSDYFYDADDESNMPTAPVPTAPAVRTTTRPLVVKLTAPSTTRTTVTLTPDPDADTTITRWVYVPKTTIPTAPPTPAPTEYAGPPTTSATTTTTIDRSLEGIEARIAETATLKPQAVDGESASAKIGGVEPKAKVAGGTIGIIIVIVVLLLAAFGGAIYRMKQKLDVTASDPNYVRGGGAAFGNPAYAPAGGAIDEANEGYLDIQEAARNAGAKKKKKKGGNLVRQESLC